MVQCPGPLCCSHDHPPARCHKQTRRAACVLMVRVGRCWRHALPFSRVSSQHHGLLTFVKLQDSGIANVEKSRSVDNTVPSTHTSNQLSQVAGSGHPKHTRKPKLSLNQDAIRQGLRYVIAGRGTVSTERRGRRAAILSVASQSTFTNSGPC